MGKFLPIFIIISIVVSIFRAVRKARLRSAYGQGPTPWNRQQTPGSATDDRAKSPYDILGIRRNASDDEITAAYRRLVQMYHPDRVANLAPEFRDLAESRMKEINRAHELLKRRRS